MDLLLPILIFFARIGDVSIGTVRIILVYRGRKFWAAALGFIEILIWLFAVAAVITNITESVLTVIAYAGGFAAGTLIGMEIEERLAIGEIMIRAINKDRKKNLAKFMRRRGYYATRVEGEGLKGPVEVVFLNVERKYVQRAINLILRYTPSAYITTEDVKKSIYGTDLFLRRPSKLPLWLKMRKFR